MALPIPKLAGGSKPSPLCTMLFLLVLCILGFYSLHPPRGTLGGSGSSRAVRFREIFLSYGSNETIAAYLRALTQRPHLAGTRQAQEAAQFVRAHFEGLGLEAHTARYGALLSYPARAALSAHFSNGSAAVFSLADAPGVVAPYHAYSPSGAAHARAVYVNHGGEGDYRALAALGVGVEGCVAVARKGGALSRGEVVRAAQDRGAVAVLLYADGDDSLTSTSGGFGNGVERGTVMRGVGDPLSPGWAAVDGGERLDLDSEEVSRRFPKIPSMPISAENAEAILGSLGGAWAPREWAGRVRRVGPGPTMLNFTYQGEKKVATIQNVFAVIRGSEEPDRYVLLGNHRDAWTYGAVDPNSGTSALLDITRRYALLTRLGWKPRRTIVFCSWDAEEFGMIGSTEWVEQNLGNLGSKAVAYLNVDCAVQGPGFFAGATPQLDNILAEITSKVKDPDSEGATVYEKWETKNHGVNIQRLGGVDSDFAPFVQHAGVPSVDIYYGKDFPVYHTAFDSYSWMTTYGDPLFHRHVAVAGVWGLLALRLADDPILPFNYMSYVNELKAYKDTLSNLLDGSGVSLNPLVTSIEELASAAREAEDEAKKLRDQESEGEVVVLKKRALNDRLMLAERGFLDADGIPGKEWFKHLVYGPQDGRESKLNAFPAVADAIARSGSGSGNMSVRDRRETIQHEIWRLARAIQRAAMALRGQIIM